MRELVECSMWAEQYTNPLLPATAQNTDIFNKM